VNPSDFVNHRHIVDLGQLLVVLPSKPSPGFLSAYFRKLPENTSRRFFEPKAHEEMVYELSLLRDLQSVLSRQGRPEDASWVAHLAQPLVALEIRLRNRRRERKPIEATKAESMDLKTDRSRGEVE
jgi:hypothetical protein